MSKRKEGLTKSNLKRNWETRPCFAMRNGQESCWCREIWTDDGILVIGSGELSQEEAEYFSKVHNFYLKNNKG
jgi:hypothetical protein